VPVSRSCASSSARTGTAISAAAVGVGARTSAAKSHSEVSVSWPTAEMVGIEQAATARTTSSSLKAHRSSIEPPPRATMTRSARHRPARRQRVEAAHRRGDLRRRALALHRTGQTMTWLGQRSASRWRMSRITAPVGEVTTPIVRGQERQPLLALGVEQPFGGERAAALVEQRHQRALPGQLQPLDDDLIFGAAGIGGELAGRDHLDAVLGPEASIGGAALPDHRVDAGALSSFSVK
jgi:hypothetical protein